MQIENKAKNLDINSFVKLKFLKSPLTSTIKNLLGF